MAVAGEEHLGLRHVGRVEQATLRPLQQVGADLVADEVAHLIAHDGSHRTDRGDDPERRHVPLAELLDRCARGQEPGEEQQRVARQEEADEQTRLGEDDQPQGNDPAGLDPFVGEVEEGEHGGPR
jgi:hypothetical protein